MCKIGNWVIFFMLVICAVVDWKEKRIPVRFLVLMSFVIGVLSLLCQNTRIASSLFGAGAGVLAFLVSRVTKEALGYGDDWLILILGIYMGGSKILQLLLWASLFSGIVSLFFLFKKKWRRDITIPFVPFLTIAYLGVMFL